MCIYKYIGGMTYDDWVSGCVCVAACIALLGVSKCLRCLADSSLGGVGLLTPSLHDLCLKLQGLSFVCPYM